jgi:NAD-dependent deacetylase
VEYSEVLFAIALRVTTMTDDVEDAAEALAAADHAVSLTGAGVSTASGIPDFRSEGGIWEEFDPAEFHYSRFRADPAGFWERRLDMHEAVYGGDVEPNAAHDALATLEERDHLDAVVTQNIDGLHDQAGSETIIELHGNAERVACEACSRRAPAAPARERVTDGELPPLCDHCEGILKPDVVLFGEQLPGQELQRAREHAREADTFLAVGSSLSVQPAASLPRTALRTDATLVVVNLEETPVSDAADYEFRADVTEILPRLVEELT